MDQQKKRLLIKTLEINQRNGQNGPFEQIVVNGQWTSIKGTWNSGWKVGGYAEGIFNTKPGKNGATYYNINCPQELRKQYGGGMSNQKLDEIINLLKQLVSLSGGKPMQATTTEPQPSELQPSSDPMPEEPQPPMPQGDDEVNVEDIPF